MKCARGTTVAGLGVRSRATRCALFGLAAVLLVAAANAMGCGDGELRTRTLRDMGSFCVESGADGSLTFSVSIGPGDPCSSGCNTNTTSCRATLAGERIELTSRIEIRDRPGIVECQSECLRITASCELDAPSPGDYTFGFAGSIHRAPLPINGAVALFGEHQCQPEDVSIPNPFP